jgi:hypothetical protein
MSSNIKQLVEDKIYSLEETLKYHALHVEILRSLLGEIDRDTGRIEVIPPVHKAAPIIGKRNIYGACRKGNCNDDP